MSGVSLDGELVLVTGGGQGLGAATSRVLAGAVVAVTDLQLRPYGVRVYQDPTNVAETIKHVLTQPPGTAIAEVMVIPTEETSWP
jgi:NADP-dependent 3-hydroxy acid dehydrogenase YdfG